MKCFKLQDNEYDLPNSLFERIGAFDGVMPVYEACYISPLTEAVARNSRLQTMAGLQYGYILVNNGLVEQATFLNNLHDYIANETSEQS